MAGRFLISGAQIGILRALLDSIHIYLLEEVVDENKLNTTLRQLREITDKIFDEQFIIDSTEPLESDLEQLQKNWRWNRPKEAKWDEAKSGSIQNTK